MPDSHEFAQSIENDTTKALAIQAEILERLESLAYSQRDIFCLRLALEEALVNAIKHGNQMDPEKQVHIRCRINGEVVRVTVEDEGAGFDPETLPDPTADENLNLPSGRGVMLIKSFMDEVHFNEIGNSITIVKYKSAAED